MFPYWPVPVWPLWCVVCSAATGETSFLAQSLGLGGGQLAVVCGAMKITFFRSLTHSHIHSHDTRHRDNGQPDISFTCFTGWMCLNSLFLTVLQEAAVVHGHLVPVRGLAGVLAARLLGHLHLQPALGDGLGPQPRHQHRQHHRPQHGDPFTRPHSHQWGVALTFAWPAGLCPPTSLKSNIRKVSFHLQSPASLGAAGWRRAHPYHTANYRQTL